MRNTGHHGRTSSAAQAVCRRAALALALAATLPAQAQEPTLWSVLVRATVYVEELHAQLSGVVMEERYQQRATLPAAFRRNDSAAFPARHSPVGLSAGPAGGSGTSLRFP